MRIVLLAVLIIFALTDFINAQVTCSEKDVFEIDRIKQEIETSLINAKDVKVKLESGENLQAFYVEGVMVKISVDIDEPFMIAELFFRDGFIRHISAEAQKDGKLQSCYLYFKDDKLICYENTEQKDVKDDELYKKAEKKWLKNVEKYLQVVQ